MDERWRIVDAITRKSDDESLFLEAVSTDIPTKSVHLRYDPDQLSMQQIEITLGDAGYTVAKEAQPTPRTSGKPLNLL